MSSVSSQIGEIIHAMSLRDKNVSYRAALKVSLLAVVELETKYQELIMSVGNKFPNESRHETAKRYILEREAFSTCHAHGEGEQR